MRKRFWLILAAVIVATVILITSWAASTLPLSPDFPAELTVQEKALLVLTDVVGLDIAKYNCELSSYFSEYPDDYGGLVREDLMYTLELAGSKMQIDLRFVNKTLWSVNLYSYNNSMLSAHYVKQLPNGILDATKVILQRLQIFSDASYIQEMLSTMDTVADINSVNATIGNLKRQVIVNTELVYRNATSNYTSTSTSIYFMYTLNDADSPKSVSVHFRDGALTGFGDGWKLFTVGSEIVNITREEAISIAREQANNSTTDPLNFGNRPVRADLHMLPREPFTLYPFWFVELPLDYPNSKITGWQVGIWADTGKIEYSHPTGIL